MSLLTSIALLLFFPALAVVAQDLGDSSVAATGWKEEAKSPDLIIYSRTREGSPLKEFKSVGMIDAPPRTVFAVLDDTEAYPDFMPYTVECRVLQRAKNSTVAYQRLELPLLSDRDYTLRSRHSEKPSPHGSTFRIRWQAANELGPEEKSGVERVKICDGGWLIEPGPDGATRATYFIYTDSGGAIPAFIANRGSRIAIGKLFSAVRKEVREPKYATVGK